MWTNMHILILKGNCIDINIQIHIPEQDTRCACSAAVICVHANIHIYMNIYIFI